MARTSKALVVCLGLISLASLFGCTPAGLNFLLMPFVDDRVPAKFPLAKKDQEVTVAIACNFATAITRTEILPADHELAQRLGQILKKRCEDNKEKIKIVSSEKVRSYQNKQANGGIVSAQEIGKHFKADYVIRLEIVAMDLYEEKSYNQLYRGNTEINVSVIAPNDENGDSLKYDEVYRRTYPENRPIEAGSTGPSLFRGTFLNHVADDLSRRFTKVPSDQVKFKMD